MLLACIQKHLSSWKDKLLSLGGTLVLINSIHTNMALYMISFLSCQKESYISSIIIDLASFSKGTTRKRNIDWLNGVLFVDLKIRVDLEFATLRFDCCFAGV
jgi:hypothetical protein